MSTVAEEAAAYAQPMSDSPEMRRGDRIAQMVVTKIYKADMRETFHLNDSNRGDGGFGHTGTK